MKITLKTIAAIVLVAVYLIFEAIESGSDWVAGKLHYVVFEKLCPGLDGDSE